MGVLMGKNYFDGLHTHWLNISLNDYSSPIFDKHGLSNAVMKSPDYPLKGNVDVDVDVDVGSKSSNRNIYTLSETEEGYIGLKSQSCDVVINDQESFYLCLCLAGRSIDMKYFI